VNESGAKDRERGGTEAPTLYQVVDKVVTELLKHGFGKRTIEVTAQDGKLLNAKVLQEDSYRLKN